MTDSILTFDEGSIWSLSPKYLDADDIEILPLSVQYRIDAEPDPYVKRFANKPVRAWTNLTPGDPIVLVETDNAMFIDRLNFEVHVVTVRAFYGEGATEQLPKEYRYRVKRLPYLRSSP